MSGLLFCFPLLPLPLFFARAEKNQIEGSRSVFDSEASRAFFFQERAFDAMLELSLEAWRQLASLGPPARCPSLPFFGGRAPLLK